MCTGGKGKEVGGGELTLKIFEGPPIGNSIFLETLEFCCLCQINTLCSQETPSLRAEVLVCMALATIHHRVDRCQWGPTGALN